jgi:glucosylglycerate phosphorylase
MRDLIQEHLITLYGTVAGTETALRLRERLQSMPRASLGQQRPLTQQDVVLITYGDQVQAQGEPPLGVLTEFCSRWLADVVSAVHILPFYPSSSDDGFSVIDYHSVDPDLGSWDDLARLGAKFDLMFDAVLNHMSAQSEWFRRFLNDDPEFERFFVTIKGDPDLSQVVRPRALPLLTEFGSATGPRRVWTTFSADQVDLDFTHPKVFLLATDVLLNYIARGARFIRLDAIAYLWKEVGTGCIHLPQTHRVIQLWRAILNEIAPGVQLITETNVPHAENVSYFGDGSNEAQLVYNFALPPLVLHSLRRQDASSLTRWGQQLKVPSDRVTFFNFLASHDGIGLNPVRGILASHEIDQLVTDVQQQGGLVSYKHNPDGSRSPYELNVNLLDALTDSDSDSAGRRGSALLRFLLAHSILFCLRGVPGIYFHSLFGSRGDPKAAESTGIPRRINREKLLRMTLEAELAREGSLRYQVFQQLRLMLRVRRQHPAFDPATPQTVWNLDRRLFVVRRGPAGSAGDVWCLHNVTDEPVTIRLPAECSELTRIRVDLLGGPVLDLLQPATLEPLQSIWASSQHP